MGTYPQTRGIEGGLEWERTRRLEASREALSGNAPAASRHGGKFGEGTHPQLQLTIGRLGVGEYPQLQLIKSEKK